MWVIVDCLTNGNHFLLVTTTDSLGKLTRLYVNKIVKLHSIPRFTSHLWKSLQAEMGTKQKKTTQKVALPLELIGKFMEEQ